MVKKMKNKDRYIYIDLLEVIAMFMVISLHTNLWHTDFIGISSCASMLEYSFRLIMEGVPIFIFANGFLLMSKRYDDGKHKNKIIKLCILFFVWAIINIISISLINNDKISLSDLLSYIFNTKVDSIYTGHLWYLQNLIMLYFIFPIIKYLYDHNKVLYKSFFYLVTIFTFGINILSLFPPCLYDVSTFIQSINPLCNGIFIFYFLLGAYVRDNMVRLENNKIKILVLGLLSFIVAISYGITISYVYNATFSDNYIYSQILLVPIVLMIFMLCTLYHGKNKIVREIIIDISKNTLGIYLIHIIINSFLIRFIFKSIDNYSFFIRFFETTLVYFISYIIVIILNKIPVIKKLVNI